MKVGFIVEGDCEKMVLSSNAFSQFLQANNLVLVDEVINARGKSNLNLPSTATLAQVLRDQGAQWIVVLRDADDMPCMTSVKQETIQADDIIVCIAVKELEGWYLADSTTLSVIFRTTFFFECPEQELEPVEILKGQYIKYRGRGINDKKKFTNLMIGHGFTIENAAQHPNCSSANYFLTKLQTLASAN
ncbi:hypothetical protein [Spirosoma telluris]|uniref:hypothetical protein n=1 Tax=Spirosoma telluris TaxID=2183553 RepID=UPI002FC29A65